MGQLPLILGGLEQAFLTGSVLLAELLSREKLLGWFGKYLPSLNTFDVVDSISGTSSFTCNSSSDTTFWFFVFGSKCSTSSSNGTLDPK